MIQIEFTKEEMEQLRQERFTHPSPKVQLKMEALYLKAKGLKHCHICDICKVSKPTLATYLKDYATGGIDSLKQIKYKGKRNLLLENVSSIEEYFHENPPRTLKEACAKIEEITGIKRSLTQIWEFLKRINFRRRKVRAIPGKALTSEKQQEQEDFVREELLPRMEEAKKGEREFFLWMPRTLSTRHS